MESMIDIEGLDLKPRSHILSVGIVVFDLNKIIDKAYWKVSPKEVQTGRSVSASTALWWMGQAAANPAAAVEVMSDTGVTLVELLKGLQEFHLMHGVGNVWANGVDYDLVNLETLFEDLGMKCPWGYRDRSDFRTVRKIVKEHNIPIELPNDTFEGVEHNALDDAMWQTKYLIAARKALGLV